MSSRSDPAESKFAQANQLWDIGKIKLAFRLFKEAAQGGDAHSANSLGYLYDRGVGVSINKKKALFWYKKAASSGDTSAFVNIALLYKERSNRPRARFWLLRAVADGDGDAALELGKTYLDDPRRQEIALGVKYLKLAEELPDATESTKEEARLLLEKFDK